MAAHDHDPTGFDPERRWLSHPDRACAGAPVEEFFSGSAPEWRATAERYCGRCPVLRECRRDTLGEPYGVWGGRDQIERRHARSRVAAESASWPVEKRLAWGEILHGLRHSRDITGRTTARLAWTRIMVVSGFQERTAVRLVREYAEHLAKRPSAAPEITDVPLPNKPPFPDGRGGRDMWVRRDRIIEDANYRGHDAEGACVLAELRSSRGGAIRTWVPLEDVRFHRQVRHYVAYREVSYGQERQRHEPAA